MTTPCPHCGTALKPQAKFCTGCGAAVVADAGTDDEALRELPLAAWPEAPAPDPAAYPPETARPAWLYTIIGALAALVLVLGAMQFGKVEEAESTADAEAAAAMAGMTDAAKIAAFRDDFQGPKTDYLTTRKVRVRNYPTTSGSKVTGEFGPDVLLQGRMVKGVDPTTRWLKTEGGYVWDGNLVVPGAAEVAVDDTSATAVPPE
jgi:zinc-ribbon domain